MAREWESTEDSQTNGGLAVPAVLLVESHTRTLYSVILAFEEAGMRVHACSTISAAEQALRHQRFHCIVLGMMVEHLFPDEMLTLLQCKGEVRPLPTVAVLSGLSEEATWTCLRPDTLVQSVLVMPLDQQRVAEWRDSVSSGTRRADSRHRAQPPAASHPKSLWAVPASSAVH
ncbi:MAG: hypothetical protein ABSE73_15660 [Planctomycetota bacterium]